MTHYFIEPRTRKHVTGYGFLPFTEYLFKKLLDTATKTILDVIKTSSKK